MKMKKIFTKTLLLAALLAGGVSSVWGAGYTRTLNENLEVAGYKAKAFYNFQNNTPAVLPTSGDYRYRDGNIWGLHNFGGGTRSATVTIPVAKDDILILQHYSAVENTINRGTKNETLSSTTGYTVYDISTTADDITFTIARYGGTVAALVMEVDNTVTTVDYTVNYKVNGVGENIKTTEGNAAVGTIINAGSSFFVGDVKYVLNGEQTTSMTLASSGTNTLNINVKEADTYTYTVNAIINSTSTVLKQLATGSTYADETVIVPHPTYINYNGTLYQSAATNNEYRKSFAVTSNDQVNTVSYTATDIKVVYFSEAEEISGMIVNTNGTNVAIRASNAAAAEIPDGGVTVCSLPAGTYKIYMQTHNTKNNAVVTVSLTCGAQDINVTTSTGVNRQTGSSDEFTVASTTDLALSSLDGNGLVDWLYVVQTAVSKSITAAGYATFCSEYAVDFTDVDGLTAYIAKTDGEKDITFETVTTIPANTGVLLKGKEANYNIPVIASADAVVGNVFVGTTESTTAPAGSFVLMATPSVGFYKTTNDFTLSANTAYLPADVVAPGRSFIWFEESGTTAIQAPVVKNLNAGEIYTIAGQRVAKPTKGLYIMNGKKVVVK